MKSYLEKFSIWNIAIVIHVVDAKCKPQFGLFVTFYTELGDPLNELYKNKDK